MKEEGNTPIMHTFSVFLDIFVFCVVVLSRRSSAADYRYEACVPRNCGLGPNVSFPFYIEGQQESYCGFGNGYPGFQINCGGHGYPVLRLADAEYVIQDIFYETRSFRVYNSLFSNSSNSNCIPRIRNTTLLKPPFDFADNVTNLRLFSNCSDSLLENPSRNISLCDGSRVLALYGEDEDVENAVEKCEMDLVAPIEDDGNMELGNLVEVLRKGFVMKWTSADCSVCHGSGGYCGFNETTHLFKCFCPDRPHSGSCKPDLIAEKGQRTLILATAISGGGAFLLIFLSIALIIWRCKKNKATSDFISKSDVELGSFQFNIPIFSYKELVDATKNFDSSNEIGDGGFGTVYYGKLHDGREVAVKRLYERNSRRLEQFMNEIRILTYLRHKNLVTLYGCTSRKSRDLLLVYEYIPNGTVADHLHGDRAKDSPLTWPIRMKIAMETASALAYLHKSDIIHRDVKTNNILLDNHFCVKVADFGLSRLFPNDVTHVSTVPQGTPGYVDPDYHQCYQLTNKSDVYSFGVVLVELISSMPAVDISRHSNEINLANLAVNRIQRRAFDDLIDPSLGYGPDGEVTRMTTLVAELAFRCLQPEKDLRPSMFEILDFLQDIQVGDESYFETEMGKNGGTSVTGKDPSSPETDDIVLLSKKSFQSSPNAVTDRWVSGSTTRSSNQESVEL